MKNAVLYDGIQFMNPTPDPNKLKHPEGAWYRFWKQETTSFHEVMRIATTYFCKQLDKRKLWKEGDQILDYGCGPGFLIDHFKGKNVKLTGVDINSFFINEAKQKFPKATFFQIDADSETNELTFRKSVGESKFDLIILLSISQYFPNLKSLQAVIDMLAHYTKSSGKIIVADVIDADTSAAKDALALLHQCIIQLKLFSFSKFMFYVLFSKYRKVSAKNALLQVSESDMMQMARKSGLTVTKMEGVTMHSSRKNYILTK